MQVRELVQKTRKNLILFTASRTINFNFAEKTKIKGISGYKYVLDEILFANETFYESNSCFNPHPTEEQFLPNGFLNVSSCKFDAPAYVSYPHFYLSDAKLLEQFGPGTQMSPSEELHGSSLSLEPGTGVPLDVKVRMQINGLARPINVTDDGLSYFTIE